MNQINSARALPQAALDFRWPFMRNSGAWGTQLIEPMAEIIVAPQAGDSQVNKYPNEDSLDLEFTDANLFGFNRFPGIDRLEGGQRANVAMHGAWYLGGTTFDGLIGQSYQTKPDNLFPEASGLHDDVSDVVARATIAPTSWLNLSYRTRLDHRNLATRFADALASVSAPHFSINPADTSTRHLTRIRSLTSRPRRRPETPSSCRATRSRWGQRRIGEIPVQRLDAARPADQPDGRGGGRCGL